MGINNKASEGEGRGAGTVRGEYKAHTWPSEIKSILNSVSALILLRRFSASGVLGQESGGVI